MLRAIAFVLFSICAAAAMANPVMQESPSLAEAVAKGELPSVNERVPDRPLIVDLAAKGRSFGQQGGTLRTNVTRSKDVRQMTVYGYARLVGYNENYELVPDILESFEVEEGRKFTLRLREGHRWSDGTPFTSDDFRYWWENVANHPELSPNGPPDSMRRDGEVAEVSFPDPLTVVIAWSTPNPNFLPLLAGARPPFIYRPAHYLKSYHADFADPEYLAAKVKEKRVRGWAQLHNDLDNMYKFSNPELPTLQPWLREESPATSRFVFARNPFYHRVDARGVQLPYIDQVDMGVVASGLLAAKANAGELDLQARGLDFRDVSILKKGQADGGGYRTELWAAGVASQIAIYPNLNYADPVWRKVIRDVRFRRALSLGIDRRMINRALYFGLAHEGAMTVLRDSPLFAPKLLTNWAVHDTRRANALLDDMGLSARDKAGIRLLPDGRPMEFVIETAGERQEVENALAIITDTWRDIGVKLVMRPLDRDILRNRVYTGVTMASVWYGWDNGLPTEMTPPDYTAPTSQSFLAWPKWGQFYQTQGEAGEPPDMDAASELLDLNRAWHATDDRAKKAEIWTEILGIHSHYQFAIGVVSEAPQPVVISDNLRNVPTKGKWAWEPGAHFGVHRLDEFYFDDLSSVQASR